MTIAGLMRKHGQNAPRFVTAAGRVSFGGLASTSARPAEGFAIKPHTFHGGEERASVAPDATQHWWDVEGALTRHREDVARFFPGFRETVSAAGDGAPAWEGRIDTGYGFFEVRVELRSDEGLPRVRVVDTKRRGKTRRGRWIPAGHMFANGGLCVAEESDWNSTSHTVADVIAWTAHWHACYVSWLASDSWPTEGLRAVA